MILKPLMKTILREHLYKPIQGRVLALGRQNIPFNFDQTVSLIESEGITINDHRKKIARDCVDSSTRYSTGDNISDKAFFSLLGVDEYMTMDVTDYEDCDFVHDLNDPIPDKLKGKFDFIIDGGTFDHLVDLRTCFENVINLLSENGRIIQWNAASNFTGSAYLSFGPDLFFDFFMVNGFSDCKVYIADIDKLYRKKYWDFYFFENPIDYGKFRSPNQQYVIVVGEKGKTKETFRNPVQGKYRSVDMKKEFEQVCQKLIESNRPVMTGTFTKEEFELNSQESWQEKIQNFAAKVVSIIGPNRVKVHPLVRSPPKGFKYIGKI